MTRDDARPLAVRTLGLGRRCGRHWALAHVDLAVEPGEILLLAGPNGSGKTTLLRLLAGLYRPSAGSLAIFGLDPAKERLACRRALTLVSHDSYLYDRLTAYETLAVWARLLGRPAGEDELVGLLAEVELAERRDLQVKGFSAGMRKRLTLLRTRLERPRLVLLDEPFSALDPGGRRMVEGWIERFRDEGIAVLMASHALERTTRIADRALLLERGQIAWQGAAAELPARMERSR